MKKVFIISLLFLSIITQSGICQQKNDSASIHLSSVEVNATRTKTYSQMARVITVIDIAEIQRTAVQSIDQLLDYISGIDIRQRGTNGTQADISIRGGSFDQVLVLLNGVNITDPQTGHFNLDIPIQLSDISRVEILNGSSARILGPNAFSGAINIITETADKQSLSAELTGGSYNYFAQSISGNFGKKQLRTFASVSHKSSTGYIDNTDFDMSNAFIQSVLNTKNKGKFDLQLAAQLKDFGANGFYSLKYPNQRENSKTFMTSMNWSLNKGNFMYHAQTYWRRHHDRFELDHNSPSGWNYHLTDITGAKLSTSFISKVGKTTVGMDVRNEHIYSNRLGLTRDSLAVPFETNVYFNKEANRLLLTGLVDHSVNIGRWYFSAGIASTNCKAFGTSVYGGLDAAYALNEFNKIFISANTSSRLPNFTNLYLTSPDLGDPNLKPEQSKTLEIGTKLNHSQWKMNASIFYRLGENVIDWVKKDSLPATKYVATNLGKVNAIGGDITLEYVFRDLFIQKISAAYSYLNLDKKAVGFDSRYALDYLKHKAVLTINHKIWKNLNASWKASYQDRSGTYDANTIKGNASITTNYKPYFMLDGRLLWSQKQYDIFADANNIFNTTYADFGGLIQPGFNFNVGVRYKL